jgi:predicted nucleic acid-binding protein
MPTRVLDTNELIDFFWKSKGEGHRLDEYDESDIMGWARNSIDFRKTDAIVTPVSVELLAGARNSHELRMFRAYLSRFHVVDDGRVLAGDWEEAARLAAWIPHDGKRRQLVDCLIRALAKRLNFAIITRDKRFSS